MQHQQMDEGERLRRQEYIRDSRAALALGMNLDQFVELSKASAADWRVWLRAEMKKSHVDDPVEILPQILARAEQRNVQVAREVAKIAAEEVARKMLGKALV